MHKPFCLAALLAAAWLPADAAALDFGNGPTLPDICASDFSGGAPLLTCNNSRYIAQSYGDVAGVLDVQYIAPRAADGRSLRWWDSGYNNLYGALWTEGGDETSQAAVTSASCVVRPARAVQSCSPVDSATRDWSSIVLRCMLKRYLDCAVALTCGGRGM